MNASIVAAIRADRTLSRHAPSVAYVLSGGAAQGFCHLGMIERIEDRGIYPDLVVGTSAGALLGALYCHFASVEGALRRVEEVVATPEFQAFERSYLAGASGAVPDLGSLLQSLLRGFAGGLRAGLHLGRALFASAIVSERDAAGIFARIFDGITVETLRRPFAAVAVDLAAGEPVVFASGAEPQAGANVRPIAPGDGLMRAVMASSAIPFIFPPVDVQGRAHVDGGVMANLPAREARRLARGEAFLAGFDVSEPVERSEAPLSAAELAFRLFDLSARSKQAADRELLDVVFRPVESAHPWSSFADYRKFLAIGRGYVTDRRILAFEEAYLEKCRVSIGRLRFVARLRLEARLKGLVSRLDPG